MDENLITLFNPETNTDVARKNKATDNNVKIELDMYIKFPWKLLHNFMIKNT